MSDVAQKGEGFSKNVEGRGCSSIGMGVSSSIDMGVCSSKEMGVCSSIGMGVCSSIVMQ